MIKALKTLIVALAVILSLNSCRLGSYPKLSEAEELSRQGQFEQAIEIYRLHMQERLNLKNRPEWENPFFYYLLIGDIELRRGNVKAALESYKMAADNQIHASLISDRYRSVATWFEEQNEPYRAIDLLKAHRELDPLLFDAVLDRISKDIIRNATQRGSQDQKGPPLPQNQVHD